MNLIFTSVLATQFAASIPDTHLRTAQHAWPSQPDGLAESPRDTRNHCPLAVNRNNAHVNVSPQSSGWSQL